MADVGSVMTASSATAAVSTTELAPAAADEVSALTAAAFAAHGLLYQQISAQATAVHLQFIATLQASAGSYAATEAANATASH